MSLLNSSHTPQLVTNTGEIIPDGWTLLADEDTTGVDGPYVLGFDRALRELDGLNGQHSGRPTALLNEGIGVRVNPGDDVRLLLPFIEKITLIEVSFPGYRDGRGYSTARILREEGYTGAIRAVGDVLRDQLFQMLRCGFSEFLVKDKDPAQAIAAARSRFSVFYQGAADTNRPVWALRHPAEG